MLRSIRSLGRAAWPVWALGLSCAAVACLPDQALDEDDAGVQGPCSVSVLAARCPTGTSALPAPGRCEGHSSGDLLTAGSAVLGTCQVDRECAVECRLLEPCPCGAQFNADFARCMACPTFTCGDGRCDEAERASCAGEPAGCAECPVDCAPPVCGDGVCSGVEAAACPVVDATCWPCAVDCGPPVCGDGRCQAPESVVDCPVDCATPCTPGEERCAGAVHEVCVAGAWQSTNCGLSGGTCGPGGCVLPPTCGDGTCDAAETAADCPADCPSVCAPGFRTCQGNLLSACNAQGTAWESTDCAASGQLCNYAQRACVAANVCGNGLCEATETGAGCPGDCPAICQPGTVTCDGTMLNLCNPDGTRVVQTNCDALNRTCLAGSTTCVPWGCGDGTCAATEDATLCPPDCACDAGPCDGGAG